jgi:uncharacterized Tic20 family protein
MEPPSLMTCADSPSPLAARSGSDRLWSVLCHLSFFFGLALLSFLFPLVVFLVMKDESGYVGLHAREALNFHLSILLYVICCAPLCLIVIGFPLLVVIGVVGVVCSLIGAVRASEGTVYHYPATIRFVR